MKYEIRARQVDFCDLGDLEPHPIYELSVTEQKSGKRVRNLKAYGDADFDYMLNKLVTDYYAQV
jgi:hypothetical protein